MLHKDIRILSIMCGGQRTTGSETVMFIVYCLSTKIDEFEKPSKNQSNLHTSTWQKNAADDALFQYITSISSIEIIDYILLSAFNGKTAKMGRKKTESNVEEDEIARPKKTRRAAKLEQIKSNQNILNGTPIQVIKNSNKSKKVQVKSPVPEKSATGIFVTTILYSKKLM